MAGGAVRLRPGVGSWAVLGCMAAIAAMLVAPVGLGGSSAAAAPPEQLWSACDGGPEDIQCTIPRGIAANPENGRVFVADQGNQRVVELTALGEFVKTWGWDVVVGGGTGFEVCVPEDGDVCKAGTEGTGAGQFGSFGPQGVALDSAGNVYVVDHSNRRVQKFDPDGNFLLSFGEAGTGNGQFGTWRIGSFIAIDPDDNVYVGDAGRIQRFDTSGVYQGQIDVPGETVIGLAADEEGDLYAIYRNKPDVRKITAAGEELESPRFELTDWTAASNIPSAVAVDDGGHVFVFGTAFQDNTDRPPIFEFEADGALIENFGVGEYSGSTGLAVNFCAGSEPPGNLYVGNVANGAGGEGPPGPSQAFVRAYGTQPIGCLKARTLSAAEVEETSATLHGTVNPKGGAVTECRFEYGLSKSYGEEAPCDPAAGSIGSGSDPVEVEAQVSGLDPGSVHHFRLVAVIDGEPEKGVDISLKTKGPPVIGAAHVSGATATEATLRATINPEGLTTTYRFEYGPQPCSDVPNPCTAIPDPDGPVGSDRSGHAVSAIAEGLAPDTTYFWRVLAVNVSGETIGSDRTFSTYRAAGPGGEACPNDALRGGDSAFLPDCRAYEMVSPVDKNGGDITQPAGLKAGDTGGYVQASPDGNRVAYASRTSFAGQPSSFDVNQYLAIRDGGEGWQSEGIHPPVTNPPGVGDISFGLEREFMAFTPNLCSAWLTDVQGPPAGDGHDGFINLYRRDNCPPGAGDLEAIVPGSVELPAGTAGDYVNNESVQGISADGSRTFFVAEAKLTPDAAEGTAPQVYERSAAGLVVISVLPGGAASAAGAAVGSGWNFNLHNAVSADGSRVYWTNGIDNGGRGAVHLRECKAPAPCATTFVGGSGALPAHFWQATPDGAKALFTQATLLGDNALRVFTVGEGAQTIAGDVRGVTGASENLERIYFVSEEALGEGASEGEPNLYLYEEGAVGFAFIATLVEEDFGGLEPGANQHAYDLIGGPHQRPTRVTPDGRRIAFQSRARLTGFDNTNADGEATVEVFTYEAGGEVKCVSCNPSGARPLTEPLKKPYAAVEEGGATKVPAAAWIPTWEHPLHASNALSEDGSRIFFNSYDRLLPADRNQAMDVYEWELPGKGSCEESSPNFFPDNGGCLYLISSGESSFESQFWEASPSGDDVFFTTDSSLVGKDPGLVDLYDARVNGGIAEPAPVAECEGEACQSPPAPPRFDAPASGAFRGPGNPPQLRNCARAAKRAARLSRRAKRSRRAARRLRSPAAKRKRRVAKRSARGARKLSRNAKRCRRANRRAGR